MESSIVKLTFIIIGALSTITHTHTHTHTLPQLSVWVIVPPDLGSRWGDLISECSSWPM